MCDSCYTEGPVVGTPYADARYHGPRSGSQFAGVSPQPRPNLIPESIPEDIPAEEAEPESIDVPEGTETVRATFDAAPPKVAPPIIEDVAPGDSLKASRFRR